MNFLDKIKTIDQIVKITKELKSQGKKIVTTNGSYDILHSGHVKSLYESKQQGDVLVVGINSDSSIKKYKSKDRPIIGEKDRSETIAGLGCVDLVFVFDETTPIAFLDKIKPDIHTNGADYGEDCVERPILEKNGGKLHLLKKYEGISTTEIINKILGIYAKS